MLRAVGPQRLATRAVPATRAGPPRRVSGITAAWGGRRAASLAQGDPGPCWAAVGNPRCLRCRAGGRSGRVHRPVFDEGDECRRGEVGVAPRGPFTRGRRGSSAQGRTASLRRGLRGAWPRVWPWVGMNREQR
jgi:hypothetical protein